MLSHVPKNSTDSALIKGVLQPPTTISCQYQNNTDALQVVCISNIEGFFLERVVFSGQKLLFETSAEAVLEVHSGAMPTAIVVDRIPCLRLRAIAV